MCNRIVLIVLILIKIALSIDPIVELPTGQILGREDTTAANKTYYAFQKIPYAKSPLGALRFKAPQPVEAWDGILNATVLDVSCYQLNVDSPMDSEDCLFVNVYTPELPDDANNVLLPVMLYIHGGAFLEGSSMQALPDLFVNSDVILVSINYRLGAFGFLSTEDDVIPGNNGLKDQRLAIQWTHDNIQLFGGDPDKITIFGQSAGAASIAYQLLNQDSTGLFSGAILESGVAISPWTNQRVARTLAFNTGNILNATLTNPNDSQELLEFLQSVEAADLDAALEQYMLEVKTLWDFDIAPGNSFAPVIEVKNPDAFITKKMYGLVQAGNFIKVPIIVGFNSEELLLFNQDPDVFQTVVEAWDNDLDLIVPNDMQIRDAVQHAEIAEAIRNIYTNGEPFAAHPGSGIRYSSDNAFIRSITKFAELVSSFTEIYFYQFSYDGELGGISVHYDGAESVGHGEELKYLFCSEESCNFSGYSDEDVTTSKRLIKMWTDFAKYRNPIPESVDLLQNVTWPQLSLIDGNFLYLDIGQNLEVKNHPKSEFLPQWNALYESLDFDDFDTY